MTASDNKSEEISPETFARWTALIPNAIRTVLYGSSDLARLVSQDPYDVANARDVRRLQELETENARLKMLPKRFLGRPTSDFWSSLQTMLKALIPPLAADGAAIIILNEPDHTPIILIETGHAPTSALRRETSLLLAGSRAPTHGMSADHHPILAGPWEMTSAQRAVLVFWRYQGAKSWEKKDQAMVRVAAVMSALLRHAGPRPKTTIWRDVTDTLTGLPNASTFATNLPRHFARLDRDALPGTLMLVSVDRFSQLNARLGRKSADEVLRQTAGFLIRVTRATDAIARMGVDEFAIWFNGVDHFTAAERAELITADVPRALAVALQKKRVPPISLSIGIAMRSHGSTETVSDLMRRADHAMDDARKAGPGCWRTSQEDEVTAEQQTSRSQLFAAQSSNVSQ